MIPPLPHDSSAPINTLLDKWSGKMPTHKNIKSINSKLNAQKRCRIRLWLWPHCLRCWSISIKLQLAWAWPIDDKLRAAESSWDDSSVLRKPNPTRGVPHNVENRLPQPTTCLAQARPKLELRFAQLIRERAYRARMNLRYSKTLYL